MGSGIGLALVRSMLEGMQGKISCSVNQAQCKGQFHLSGCCFYIELPVASELDNVSYNKYDI